MKRIGVVTAGGDAPGMNACLRAVVRSAIYHGLDVIGIEEGFAGLIQGKYKKMNARSVSGIINMGGTILRTNRCEEMKTSQGLEKAVREVKKMGLDGLIVIGGDGSMMGAYNISNQAKIPVIGIPATIDNDIAGTDTTIGFDTAVNTALQAIDKIRDTASSHERVFVVEVMGRKRGFLALEVGFVCGAELILIPEIKYSVDELIKTLEEGKRRGKKSIIIVMAEGAGNPTAISEHLADVTGYEVRVSSLGYIQRGGSPTANSIKLASLFGNRAVELLLEKSSSKMIGVRNEKLVTYPLDYPIRHRKKISDKLYKLAQILST